MSTVQTLHIVIGIQVDALTVIYTPRYKHFNTKITNTTHISVSTFFLTNSTKSHLDQNRKITGKISFL